METKISVVVDNIPADGMEGEWGLCVLIKYAGKKILLDAGASDLFLENMKKMGIDVADIDYAVLSHAHYDHANGLPAFLDHNSKAKLYLREHTSTDCYGKRSIFRKYIGIPRKMLKKYSDRIQMVSGDFEMADGVWLVPHKTAGLEVIGKRELLYRKQSGRLVPDDFSHEQSLVLDTDKGLVILNSCSHGGAANIIDEIRSTFPDKKVYGLIGGFHLFRRSEPEVREFAGKIRDTGIEYICTGHCTKERAYGILKEELGDIAHQMHVGYEIVI